jgi:hypothetical protein
MTDVCGPRVGPDPVGTFTDAPETPGMVAAWERNRNRYKRAGLCDYCGTKAAYGHQLGFARIEPPRVCCAAVMASFPVPKPNGWRALAPAGAQRLDVAA